MKFSDKDLLFEDNHLLAVYKPGDIPTQKAPFSKTSLEESVKEYLRKREKKKTVFLQPVHRLDKPVSGIVLFAKSSKALSRLHEEQRNGAIEKIYLAEVEGRIKKNQDRLIHYLKKKEYRQEVCAEGKKAVLDYSVLERRDKTTLLKIRLITGRYHQIRAQCGYIRHPVVGDCKYGSKECRKEIRLRHNKMEFVHPVKKEKIIIELKKIF